MSRQQAEHSTSQIAAQRLPGTPAAREIVPSDPDLSGRWNQHGVPGPYSWNYHPEFEVHLINSGTGRCVVGDYIGNFSAGQLVLVGSNLPHHWISDLRPGQQILDRDIVFQFHPDWVEKVQVVLPELRVLTGLLTRSARGIEFSGATAVRGAAELRAIGTSTGAERLRHIFGLFEMLAAAPPADHRTLTKAWLPPLDDQHAAEIIDRTFAYILDNLTGEVRLTAAADRAQMSESAFSKYFKRMSGQTFTDTVRKLRLTQACRLLRDTDLPVSAVSYRVGYANLSNFNRQFRAQYGVTPRDYRRPERSPTD